VPPSAPPWPSAERAQRLQDGQVGFPLTIGLDTLRIRDLHGGTRRGLGGKGLNDSGFADAGLSGDEHHLSGALLRVPQGPLELLQDGVPLDKE
jgi:hypothetical protein